MKTVFTLVVIGLIASVFYSYFIKDPLKRIVVENDVVTVDAHDYVAKFSVSGEFRETYMIFGGEYLNNKKLVHPLWLSGLGIVAAKNIYTRYPDFYRCKSPGAALAQPQVVDLNLIPAGESVLNELKNTIEEYQKNFSSNGDRVCVSLVGKTLKMQSAKVPKQNIDIKEHIPYQAYVLIHSSQRVNCKNLLDTK